MMKHVVCFKLKEPNEQLLHETKDLLLTMKGSIPEVVDVNVGLDFCILNVHLISYWKLL